MIGTLPPMEKKNNFFIIEEAKKTIIDFSLETVRVL